MPSELPAASPWLTADAERWLAAREPRWTKARFMLPLLVVGVVLAMATAQEPVCTIARPCGPEWADFPGMVLAVGMAFWYLRLPHLTTVAAAASAVLLPWTAVGLPLPAASVLALGITVAGVGSLRRVMARHRQRLIALTTTQVQLPAPFAPWHRGKGRAVFGALLCAGAVGALLYGQWQIHLDRQHELRAQRSEVTVIDRDTDDMTVSLLFPDGSRRTVDSWYPESYKAGQTVSLLRDASWSRLQTERYDATDPGMLALLLLCVGVGPLVGGLTARSRIRALFREPVPALAVLTRFREDGTFWVHPADDTEGRRPVLTCWWEPSPEHDQDERFADIEEDEDGGPPERTIDTSSRTAVLLGIPTEGSLVVLLADAPHGPVVLHAGPIRCAAANAAPEPKEPEPAEPAELEPSPSLRSWGPPWGQRAVGLALLLVLFLMAAHLGDRNAFLTVTAFAVYPTWWSAMCARLLHWQVLADRSGLHLTGAWRTRSVPWAEVQSITADKGGKLTVNLTSGAWIAEGEGSLAGILGTGKSSARAAAELTALQQAPSLRPTEILERDLRLLPAAPFVSAAVLGLLLWSTLR